MRDTKRLKACRKAYEKIARRLPWMAYPSFEEFAADAVVRRLEDLTQIIES